MDLIATASRLPGPGESVGGGIFRMAPGGKAGNQASQCALAGARTHIVTRLGGDGFGDQLRKALTAKGVDTTLIATDFEAPTGASTVFAAQGDYSSIIAPGAAARLSPEDLEQARPAIEQADALVIQFELPVAISTKAAEIAVARGKKVVLNASPMPDAVTSIPESLWPMVSILVVNRVEAGRLLARPFDPGNAGRDIVELADKLGVETVAVTLGAAGAVAARNGAVSIQPGIPAEVVDAVGAGDAFLGTFVTALLEGLPVPGALHRAAAAGALAVSHAGVYDALPTRVAVDRLLGDHTAA